MGAFLHEHDKMWLHALLTTPAIDINLVKVVLYKMGYDDIDTPIQLIEELIRHKYTKTRDPNLLPFREQLILEDKEFIEDLIEEGIIKMDDDNE